METQIRWPITKNYGNKNRKKEIPRLVFALSLNDVSGTILHRHVFAPVRESFLPTTQNNLSIYRAVTSET